eukprot:Hpha_TRINITY_DN17419_c0_g1::TRINITY_DN17419_c0_g1_i1::g.85853::m.85853
MQITGQRKKKRPSQAAAGAGHSAAGAAVDITTVPASTPDARSSVIQYTPQAGVARVLRPGMVLLKGVIPLTEQQRVIDEAFRLAEPSESSPGLYESTEGRKPRLNQGWRGRLILPVNDLSPPVAKLCGNAVRQGIKADPQCLTMEPTTVLVNFYDPRGTFKWHRDTERPDLVRAGKGLPIVSASIGLSCVFAYKDEYEQQEHGEVTLESGDILIFGGPSRLIVHSVLRIIPGTCPPTLRWPHGSEGRLNLTFREVQGRIDASAFPAYRVAYDIDESPDGPPE